MDSKKKGGKRAITQDERQNVPKNGWENYKFDKREKTNIHSQKLPKMAGQKINKPKRHDNNNR